jgi:DNA-binding MarR family transcriptional regulator
VQETAQSDRVAQAVRQFRIIVRALRTQQPPLERAAGMSGAQLRALARIGASPGMKVGDLAHDLALHISTVSNLLDSLSRSKLILRRRGKNDQRVVHLYLTAKGRRVLSRTPAASQGVLQDALRGLPREQLTALSRAMQELIEQMQLNAGSGRERLLVDPVR